MEMFILYCNQDKKNLLYNMTYLRLQKLNYQHKMCTVPENIALSYNNNDLDTLTPVCRENWKVRPKEVITWYRKYLSVSIDFWFPLPRFCILLVNQTFHVILYISSSMTETYIAILLLQKSPKTDSLIQNDLLLNPLINDILDIWCPHLSCQIRALVFFVIRYCHPSRC